MCRSCAGCMCQDGPVPRLGVCLCVGVRVCELRALQGACARLGLGHACVCVCEVCLGMCV